MIFYLNQEMHLDYNCVTGDPATALTSSNMQGVNWLDPARNGRHINLKRRPWKS